MKTTFYFKNKKTTKKALVEQFGKETIDEIVKEAKETYREDPYICNSCWMGSGMLEIEFC